MTMYRAGRALLLAAALCAAACSSKTAAPPEEKKPSGDALTLNPEAARNLGVQFAKVDSQLQRELRRLTGTVRPIESRVTHLRPLARGRITEVLVKVGDRVERGQALLRYDNVEAGELLSQYRASSAELQRLRVQQASSARIVQRNQNLVRLGAVPAKELELAQAEQESILESIKAQESIRAGIAAKLNRFGMTVDASHEMPVTTLRAPFTGLITEQNASVGEMVDSQDSLFAVADLSDVWVQADVYERDLSRVRVGQPAIITSAAYPGRQFPARVAYVSDIVDPETRTIRVRCEARNADTALKLGMFVWVDLPDALAPSGIVVPIDAVQEVSGRQVVFVRSPEGLIRPRPVKAGRAAGTMVAILEGLQPGDEYATAGSFHLRNMLAAKQAED